MQESKILRVGLFLVKQPELDLLTQFITRGGISCITNGDTLQYSVERYQAMKRVGAHIAILGLIAEPNDTDELLRLIKSFSHEQQYPIKTVGLIDKLYGSHELVSQFDKTVTWSMACAPVLIASCRELANSL